MADTFSRTPTAPPSAQVLQRTLQQLEILLAEPAHSRNGTWCQQRQRALLWRNRPCLQLLAGFAADGSTDLLFAAMTQRAH